MAFDNNNSYIKLFFASRTSELINNNLGSYNTTSIRT